jgi:hypothetical protein
MPDDFLILDLKLPNHNVELMKAEAAYNKIKSKFDIYKDYNTLTDALHINMFEETVRILVYVGNLSMYAFDIEDELERMYIKQYTHAPEMAKLQWMQHYEHIHQPYTLMKNRCYRLLEDLDKLYFTLYKKDPPNIKI